ncbi:MAG: hypothetical protein ACK56F_05660, partial [bacterium]
SIFIESNNSESIFSFPKCSSKSLKAYNNKNYFLQTLLQQLRTILLNRISQLLQKKQIDLIILDHLFFELQSLS